MIIQLRIFLLLAVALILASGLRAQVIVIANPGVKGDSISKSDLRKVFTGESSALQGVHVKPVLLKEGTTHAKFASTDLGMSPVMLLAAWRSLVFAGQVTMPKTFDDEAGVVAFVSHNPGAIGYITEATPHAGCKVLEVK